MADSIIEEMGREILDLRNTTVHPNTLRRWARHLRDEVQPMLDELAALKTAKASKAKAVAQ